MTHHASFYLILQKTTITWYKTRSRATTGTRSSAHCILSSYTTRTTTVKCSAPPCVSCLMIWNMILVLSLNCNDRPASISKRHYQMCLFWNTLVMDVLVNTRISRLFSISAITVVILASCNLELLRYQSWEVTMRWTRGNCQETTFTSKPQRPVNDQILLFDKVMTFCTTSIKGITSLRSAKMTWHQFVKGKRNGTNLATQLRV